MGSARFTAQRSWRPPPFIRNANLRFILIAGTILYLFFALSSIEVNWTRVLEGGPRATRFILAFFPPDFISRGSAIFGGVLESLWMTVAATAVGVFLAVPLALGGASNLAPWPVYLICRSIMAVTRTFPEILVAIFFVKLFGFGTFAGFLTLTFATVGFNAKLLAEDIESINPSSAEAVRATGAGWFSWLAYGIQPQVLPRAIGLAIYRLDINFRESAIIGIVGAGGIGATLTTAFDRYEYESSAAILIVIITIVMITELTSGRIRQWVK
ncbi:MAG: phosphonate ABC transporter, permease protein PhnE [Candidatus Marinimicrobia bacterium]|nr:phosphonate ABC transporter, permease protein PhnE [Candidatus Neomarinimicrobiota bacterium]